MHLTFKIAITCKVELAVKSAVNIAKHSVTQRSYLAVQTERLDSKLNIQKFTALSLFVCFGVDLESKR
jgi:hypothetical protein